MTTLTAINIRVNDIELANEIIAKMNKTHFDQIDQIEALRAENQEMRKALQQLVNASSTPMTKERYHYLELSREKAIAAARQELRATPEDVSRMWKRLWHDLTPAQVQEITDNE